ncbi:MAG: rod shape-determining protein MreB [Armatimonadaceae bacterium]
MLHIQNTMLKDFCYHVYQTFRPDVAVDLGTANTRIAPLRGHTMTESPSTCGDTEALRAGVVVNTYAAAEVLRPAFHRFRTLGILRPRVLACAPSDTTDNERQAVIESCYDAGAAAVALLPEPVAAAIGDGVDIQTAPATLIMDIGDGVTDCALIRDGRLLLASARRVACSNFHRAVQSLACDRYGVQISLCEARRNTEAVGMETPAMDEAGLPILARVSVEGTSLRTGQRETVHIPLGLVQEAFAPIAAEIAQTAWTLVAELHSALRQEARKSGLRLTGGGALLPGATEFIEQRTGMPVQRVQRPLESVVGGAKALLPLAAQQNLWKGVIRL